jgi:hypothetical protein
MGTVWRAWDERLKRQVAAKRIRADATISHLRARLRREAQAAARLNHPAIVHIYDIVEEDGGDWIIMELVRGQTLRQWLTEKGPLHPAMAARIGCEIAEGLGEAHAIGILHRDLKAANVMVTPTGRAKILDFGLAKELMQKDAEQDPTLSASGAVLGTTYAMSPEQALGRELDARSDLFSLGALLYEALTGRPPFLGDSPTASLARVLSFQPPPLRQAVPGLPSAFADLVERLLEKEPAGRPGGAREVVEALAAVLAEEGGARAVEPASPAPQIDESTFLTLDQKPLRRLSSGREHRRALGERRLLTVICCGLVEWDEDSGEAGFLDLEVLSESMAFFQELAREVCERRSGCLGTELGHLLWLYFGYPHAHEDDVQRAVRSARELTARIGELGARFGKRQLALRVAVHTGPAAVVSGAGQENRLQLGSVLELATSLLSAAPVGEVIVSGTSRKLIERDFMTEALPPVHVPLMGEAVCVYRVLREIDRWERGSGESTPLVGREREIELLEDRFRLTCSGMGQAILIVGEAGIGKSRLVKALQERLAARAPVWWVAYGSPSTRNSPLAPMIELLDRILSGSDEISPSAKLDRLEELLEGSPGAEHLPLLADLLSLPPEGRHAPPRSSPETQRKRTFEALVELLAETAERQALVLVVEDLHWLDPSTLELLDLLLEEISALPLMLIATCRPEPTAPWGHRGHVVQLGLSRLTEQEAVDLIDRVAGDGEMPRHVRQQIFERTDGVPLFIEELTRAVLEGRTQTEIPVTLGGSLAARFDRLSAGKEVAQIASVIGRTFSPELLRAIAPVEAADAQKGLDELVLAGLVHRRGAGPRAKYTFKHALIQDAAYASLLVRDRRDLHQRIALFLEEMVMRPDRTPLSPWLPPAAGNNYRSLLAHHWSQATDPRFPAPEMLQKAMAHLIAAGEHALGLGAYREASAHLEAALGILQSLPEGQERDRQELIVQMRKGIVLNAIHGWGTPEVGQAYLRARELCLELGERKELPQIVFGLWAHNLFHNEYENSARLAEEYLREARQTEGMDLVMAHSALGNILLGICRLPESLYHLEMALALATGRRHDADHVQHGLSSWIYAAGLSVWALAHLGMEREAADRHDAMLRLAGELGHPFTTAAAVSASMAYHRMRGDAAAVLSAAEKVRELSKAMGGLPDYELAAELGAGWAWSMHGRAGEMADKVLNVLASLPKRIGQVALASFCVIGVQVCQQAGRIEEALALSERGLIAARNGQHLAEAELLYLRGELLRDGAGTVDLGAGNALAQAFDLACQRSQILLAERSGALLLTLSEKAGNPEKEREIGRRLQELHRDVSLAVGRVMQQVERDAGRPWPSPGPEGS